MLNNSQPVFSILAAVFFFNEVISYDRVFGAAMLLGGIVLMQWSESRVQRT